ncbi:molybdopterin-containing oxidoreductase family protein [Rubrobacter marinus]|uniref:molybdopterin-containing oxidoreductase family protein n=1 Tax=Rubrobacter marinus TaxID=2653852 RepID=UPI001A9D38C9|nr:molybdopterin oxidoreductase family protein [Rubrobacter marinus]
MFDDHHGRGRAGDGVRGNPDHPFTRGALCAKTNDFHEKVHSPERVLYPLRRAGRKGSGEFERVGWEDALGEIKDRWDGIVAEHGPTAILPYSYLGTEGILNGLNVGDAFFNKLGATITERTFCDSGSCTAYIMTLGPAAGIDPESFKYSRYIVLWASNPLSTSIHHWPFIAEAQKNGAKVVVVDPVKTRTAKQADWHVPIRPGTDAALALGMMNVIISEGLIDRDYVENYTVGYEELAERAAEYPPDLVAGITGVPADDIRKLAREYATQQPSVIRLGVAIERHPGGGQAVRALASLPALVGAWRRVGGGILQLPLWAFPIKWDGLMRPDWIRPNTRVLNQWHLGRALTGEMDLDPPIKSLMVYNSNPAVVAPEQRKVLAGLAREDLFTVVSEQFMTDTALHADLVLPAATQLEQYDMMFSWGHFYLSLNQPAIDPLGEAVPNRELFRRLAEAMGFGDDPQWQRSARRCAIDAIDWESPVMEGIDMETLERQGYARLNVGTPETYAPHAEGNFPTPSGKVELKASMAEGGNFVLPLFRQGSNEFQAGEPIDPLPHYVPRRETAETDPQRAARFPLSILSPKSHAYLNSIYGNRPRQQRLSGDQFVMINPEDAAARDIGDGEDVRVHNDRGEFDARARVTDDVAPGVVVAPMGYWRTFTRTEATVNAVNSGEYADMGRAPTFSDNLVEVARRP